MTSDNKKHKEKSERGANDNSDKERSDKRATNENKE